MDILIKGMKMKDYPQSITINPDGSVVKDTFGLHRLMDEWKAVALPEHDDLISRRDAIDAVYGYHINNHPMKELEELIPVIPASQGKENKPYYSDPTCKYNMWDGE